MNRFGFYPVDEIVYLGEGHGGDGVSGAVVDGHAAGCAVDQRSAGEDYIGDVTNTFVEHLG